MLTLMYANESFSLFKKKSENPEYKHLPSFVREEKDSENIKLIFNEFIHLYKKKIK